MSADEPSDRLIGKVASDLDSLEDLQAVYKWTPGRENIRPTPEIKAKKFQFLNRDILYYQSEADYIWDIIFNKPTKLDGRGKIYTAPEDKPEKHEKYVLPPGTEHWVMWYAYLTDEGRKVLSDEQITDDIYKALQEQLKDEHFEFIWYENPKMTISTIYHVQVFWHRVPPANVVK